MASLIEELINVLEEECVTYEELNQVSLEKTQAIISNNLSTLETVNIKEQEVVDRIAILDTKRDNQLKEISTVLNQKGDKLTITRVIELMSRQPEFQNPLMKLHKRLKESVLQVKSTNEHNRDMLENVLEMTEISINLLQNINQAPETANYDKGVYSGDTLGATASRFDTKQ